MRGITMRIELQPRYKSMYAEHTELHFTNKISERGLTRALGALDDGEAEAIVIDGQLSSDMIENFLVSDIYKVTY
jgi:hypothetical protein